MAVLCHPAGRRRFDTSEERSAQSLLDSSRSGLVSAMRVPQWPETRPMRRMPGFGAERFLYHLGVLCELPDLDLALGGSKNPTGGPPTRREARRVRRENWQASQCE